jgi:hypothetical protein
MRRSITVVLVLVLVLAPAPGTAYAAWTSSGTPPGTASAAWASSAAPSAAWSFPAAAPPDGGRIQELFRAVDRATPWQLVERVSLGFDAHHPEGLVRVRDRFVLSTVEVLEPSVRYPEPRDGTDRTPGRGIGHLIAFDATGRALQDQRLDDGADIYHPGGLDFDGERLWVAVAEYRPNRPSIVFSVDPATLVATEELRVSDHIGGIVHDTDRRRVVGLNWGSRVAYEWSTAVSQLRRTRNPSHFVDYQDCKFLGSDNDAGQPRMLCGGIATLSHPGVERYDLGALALLSLPRLSPVHEVPFLEYSPAGRVGTHNAMWVEVVGGRLRLYLVPDDDQADMLVYEAPGA